ncbi:prepilin peptidase [Actinocatenispora rupis]|uniref:Prepilin type IV endopeptidase peptidase domain-containing protein n=1 Tax=Actinocatenispora rupis TaxID=519421 RepID=A0A8J3J342_9ACTN|nr:prepilin peptidase [Actinocatenispora rupis]GID14936.1 hypothetical protein Aru02nite_58250 [Actinocatenispora rupis]
MAAGWLIGVAAGAGAAAGVPLAGVAWSVPPSGRIRLSARWWAGAPAPLLVRVLVCGVGAGLALAVAIVVGGTAIVAACWVLAVLAGPLAISDLRRHRLPDVFVVTLAGAVLVCAGIAWAAGTPGARAGIARLLIAAGAILVAGTVLVLATGTTGYGDVKLLAVTGGLSAWFSWDRVILGLLLAYGIAAAAAVGLVLAGRARRSTGIGIGPALLAGALVAMLI